MRRARQQHDDFFFAIGSSADPLAWGCAVCIRQYRGAADHVRLLDIVRRHLPTVLGESAFDRPQYFRIAPQLQA